MARWHPDQTGYRHSTHRVLVVDDEQPILEFLTSTLEDEGYEVLKAMSAREALQLIHSRRPKLVISDIMMPGGTGLDLYGWMQDLDQAPRLVFMSAVSRRSPLPDIPLVEKPFDIDDMLDVVSRELAATVTAG